MTAHQDALDPDLGVMPIPAAAVEVGIRDHLVIVVEGQVIGQGSKKMVPGNRFIDDNDKRLRPWRQSVRDTTAAAMAQMHPGVARPLFARGTPVHVSLVFTFKRPGSHFGTGRNAGVLKASAPAEHLGYPDIDKAIRGCLDAITSSGIWDDDKQVSRIIDAAKVYPGGHRDALTVPGAVIRIRTVAP